MNEKSLVEKAQDMLKQGAPSAHHATSTQWLEAWRELANITDDIEKSDRRHMPILDLLRQCDWHFDQGDWLSFKRAAGKIKRIMGWDSASAPRPARPSGKSLTVKVGDSISYQIPGNDTEGPFPVVQIVPDLRHYGWWALIEKPDSLVWVHQGIVISR